VHRRAGIGQERRQVRAASLPPAAAVAAAELVLPPGPVAPGDPARRSAEHPILGVRNVDVDPELRPEDASDFFDLLRFACRG